MSSYVSIAFGLMLLLAQDQAPLLPPPPPNAAAPSLSAPDDPGWNALIATCRTPPPPRGGGADRGGARGGPPPDPLDCAGLNPNDLTADSKGGVYFTQGGVYYANPQGVVSKYGQNITPNGIILSADEKRLYVTNGPVLAAFDVQPDGSLTNQREFAKLEGGGNGDGSTIDAAGRIYVTANPGVQVIAPDGTYLGTIPTPRPVISVAFGGPGKRTLFVLARGARDAAGTEVANAAQVYSIETIAQGYRGRPK